MSYIYMPAVALTALALLVAYVVQQIHRRNKTYEIDEEWREAMGKMRQ